LLSGSRRCAIADAPDGRYVAGPARIVTELSAKPPDVHIDASLEDLIGVRTQRAEEEFSGQDSAVGLDQSDEELELGRRKDDRHSVDGHVSALNVKDQVPSAKRSSAFQRTHP